MVLENMIFLYISIEYNTMKQTLDLDYDTLCKEYRRLKKMWHSSDKTNRSNDILKKIKSLKQQKQHFELTKLSRVKTITTTPNEEVESNSLVIPTQSNSNSLFFEPFNMTPIFDSNLLIGINQISKNDQESVLNGLKKSAVSYTAKSIEINREGKFSYESIHHDNGNSNMKKLQGTFKPQDLESFSNKLPFF
jgi:hypothetical protein